jgi:hypothetical protein
MKFASRSSAISTIHIEARKYPKTPLSAAYSAQSIKDKMAFAI